MNLDKASFQADKIVNLYRAAFSLAIGNQNQALAFLKKSPESNFSKMITRVLNKNQQLLLSEKILDQYHQALVS